MAALPVPLHVARWPTMAQAPCREQSREEPAGAGGIIRGDRIAVCARLCQHGRYQVRTTTQWNENGQKGAHQMRLTHAVIVDQHGSRPLTPTCQSLEGWPPCSITDASCVCHDPWGTQHWGLGSLQLPSRAIWLDTNGSGTPPGKKYLDQRRLLVVMHGTPPVLHLRPGGNEPGSTQAPAAQYRF